MTNIFSFDPIEYFSAHFKPCLLFLLLLPSLMQRELSVRYNDTYILTLPSVTLVLLLSETLYQGFLCSEPSQCLWSVYMCCLEARPLHFSNSVAE